MVGSSYRFLTVGETIALPTQKVYTIKRAVQDLVETDFRPDLEDVCVWEVRPVFIAALPTFDLCSRRNPPTSALIAS